MKGGAMLLVSVRLSAGLAAVSIALGAASAHLALGMGFATGLLIGSANGRLVLATLDWRAPFVIASVGRLILLTVAAVIVAIVLGPAAWSVPLGVAAAQFLLVASAVRQGLRT